MRTSHGTSWVRPGIGVLLCATVLSSHAHAASAPVIYTYDQVGRVATALYDSGTCIVYLYDANGNRTSQTNTNGGGPETPTWGTGTLGCFAWTPQSARLERRPLAQPLRVFARHQPQMPQTAGELNSAAAPNTVWPTSGTGK